jgi:hypothetical protein
MLPICYKGTMKFIGLKNTAIRYDSFNPLKPAALTINNSSFCIYVFRMILTVNSYYFLKQR